MNRLCSLLYLCLYLCSSYGSHFGFVEMLKSRADLLPLTQGLAETSRVRLLFTTLEVLGGYLRCQERVFEVREGNRITAERSRPFFCDTQSELNHIREELIRSRHFDCEKRSF